jgi:3-oxoacyl-[acyl-carrier protein] reductase
MRRFDLQVAVNLRSAFLLVQGLLPALRTAAADRPASGAKVVALASITGVAAEPGLAAYGATKAALISLCESITVSEADNGVSACAISPGYVDTDMSTWMHDRLDPDHMITVHDVAELVLAVSHLSRYAAVPNIVLTRPGTSLWRA